MKFYFDKDLWSIGVGVDYEVTPRFSEERIHYFTVKVWHWRWTWEW